MDLKAYYQKLRTTEASLTEPQVVVVSLGTPDGGRAGVLTEVPRAIAAKMIVEGSARLATEEEAGEFRAQSSETRRLAEQAAAASRIQVTVISEPAPEPKKPASGPLEESKRQKAKSKSDPE
jgi:hypothetical protein